jgi:hypothetical protein
MACRGVGTISISTYCTYGLVVWQCTIIQLEEKWSCCFRMYWRSRCAVECSQSIPHEPKFKFVAYIYLGVSFLLSFPWLRFSPYFFLSLRQMPEYTSQRRALSALFLTSELCCAMYCFCRLCCSMYSLRVNVYCTTATGWQPNCS